MSLIPCFLGEYEVRPPVRAGYFLGVDDDFVSASMLAPTTKHTKIASHTTQVSEKKNMSFLSPPSFTPFGRGRPVVTRNNAYATETYASAAHNAFAKGLTPHPMLLTSVPIRFGLR